MTRKAELMDETAVRRAIMRISHEIIEKNHGADQLCLIGIKRRGETLAEMIRENIQKIENIVIPCASIDVRLYRDDLTQEWESHGSKQVTLPFSIANRTVVLVDDVIYTGRTTRAAIEALFSLGRPSSVQLAVLIDRGHRELPFRPDYVGKNIPTSKREKIAVLLPAFDNATGVMLYASDEQ